MTFAAMQFLELRTRVREILEDENTGAYQWSDVIVNRNLNDALQHIARDAKLYNVKSAALAVEATLPTNAFYALPADFFALTRLENDGTPLTRAELTALPVGWSSQQGTPTRFLLGELGGYGSVRVLPYPGQPEQWLADTAYAVGDEVRNGSYNYVATASGTSDSSGGPTGTGTGIADGTVAWDYLSDYASQALTSLVAYYQALPAPMVEDEDVPDIPPGYAIALVYYAVAQCLLRNFEGGDPEKAAYFLGRYQEEVRGARTHAARRFNEPTDSIGWERF